MVVVCTFDGRVTSLMPDGREVRRPASFSPTLSDWWEPTRGLKVRRLERATFNVHLRRACTNPARYGRHDPFIAISSASILQIPIIEKRLGER